MLGLGIFHWPIGYYSALRWVVCLTSVTLAWVRFKDKGAGGLTLALVAFAILFNPIAPIYLKRAVWFPIDIAGALFFLVYGLLGARRSS